MFKIGERLIYGTLGVMELIDICRMESLGEEREYYVLREWGAKSSSLTYVPTDNRELVGTMRPLLSREEILELIDSARLLPECAWAKDSRLRSERFKKIIAGGDRTELIKMIKTIYEAQREREREGKKVYLSDENAMHKAERLLYSEFSAVLGIPEREIPSFIASRCDP